MLTPTTLPSEHFTVERIARTVLNRLNANNLVSADAGQPVFFGFAHTDRLVLAFDPTTLRDPYALRSTTLCRRSRPTCRAGASSSLARTVSFYRSAGRHGRNSNWNPYRWTWPNSLRPYTSHWERPIRDRSGCPSSRSTQPSSAARGAWARPAPCMAGSRL